MNKADVGFTTTAEFSVHQLQSSLSMRRGKPAAKQIVSELVQSTIDLLSKHPLSCPISQQASLLGVLQYREYIKDGYRVLYEYFPDENLVAVALVISQRQSLQQALIDYCLLWTP